jgi:hypothetical protein
MHSRFLTAPSSLLFSTWLDALAARLTAKAVEVSRQDRLSEEEAAAKVCEAAAGRIVGVLKERKATAA